MTRRCDANVRISDVVIALHDASLPAVTRKFIDGVLAAVGVVYLAYFVVTALGDLDGLLTRETAEDFLVGPTLGEF